MSVLQEIKIFIPFSDNLSLDALQNGFTSLAVVLSGYFASRSLKKEIAETELAKEAKKEIAETELAKEAKKEIAETG